MAYRGGPIDSEEAGFELYGKRVRSMEEAHLSRLLPPGYHFNIVDGNLVLTRASDGATSTLVFS